MCVCRLTDRHTATSREYWGERALGSTDCWTLSSRGFLQGPPTPAGPANFYNVSVVSAFFSHYPPPPLLRTKFVYCHDPATGTTPIHHSSCLSGYFSRLGAWSTQSEPVGDYQKSLSQLGKKRWRKSLPMDLHIDRSRYTVPSGSTADQRTRQEIVYVPTISKDGHISRGIILLLRERVQKDLKRNATCTSMAGWDPPLHPHCCCLVMLWFELLLNILPDNSNRLHPIHPSDPLLLPSRVNE